MNSIYKIIVVFIFLFLNLQASEFCSIEQYNKENPSQIKISKDFKEIVKNNAVPINIKNKKEVKIVVVYPGDQISDYWRRS
ncbi:MAG: sugar ABC transporter substrate-binding protein, partial [Campylobacterota bacterium]|nr:sugar ABC transporter substrate-binding protein [Campylobacterota bacterium]